MARILRLIFLLMSVVEIIAGLNFIVGYAYAIGSSLMTLGQVLNQFNLIWFGFGVYSIFAGIITLALIIQTRRKHQITKKTFLLISLLLVLFLVSGFSLYQLSIITISPNVFD
jgi:hypothetical protein